MGGTPYPDKDEDKDQKPKIEDKVVHLSKHVTIHTTDPRYERIKAAYEAAADNWLQNWKNEDRIWQSVCFAEAALCPKGLRELVQYGAINDNLRHGVGAVLIALDRPLRKLIDPKSMVGATETELRAMLPEDWVELPLSKGVGRRYGSPAKGNRPFGAQGWAEFNEGVPTSQDELHHGKFIGFKAGGLQWRVAGDGNPIIGSKGIEASIQDYVPGSPGAKLEPTVRRPYFRLPWR